MLNLLKKDLYLLFKPQIWLVLLTNAFLWDIYSGRLESIAFVGPVLAFQFILLLVVYEVAQKNDVFFNSLPITRKALIHTKYAEGVVFTGMGYVLAFVLELPVFLVNGFHLFSFTYSAFVRGIAFALVLMAVFFFVQIRGRAGNAEIAFGSALVVSVLFAALALLAFRLANAGGEAMGSAVLSLILLAAVLIYGLSYLLSLRTYQHKDI